MPRGFFSFMPIKINLMSKAVVIRYEMVVGELSAKIHSKSHPFYSANWEVECGHVNTVHTCYVFNT